MHLVATVTALLLALLLTDAYLHVPSYKAQRWERDEEETYRVRRHPERDMVRERAKANYDKVVQELNDRFRNYKEDCFPRPKGCLCRIGMDRNGRDITQRFKNDADCKTNDPNLLEEGRGVHDSRDRGGKKAPDYGQRGGAKRRLRRHH